MPDPEFLQGIIGKPIADLSPERREQIQTWLIIAFKKIEYGLARGFSQAGIDVRELPRKHQSEIIIRQIWEALFRVPLIEILADEDAARDLIEQNIRPMTVDELFEQRYGTA